jgi:hypothetical protein
MVGAERLNRKKGRKHFFFEKKKQKTFDYLASVFPDRCVQNLHPVI